MSFWLFRYDLDIFKNSLTGTVTETINVPATKVWAALTTPEIIKKYFFGTDAKSDWKVGSPLIYSGSWQGKTYQDKGTILALEPNKLLKHTYWSSMSGVEDKPENYVTVTYELTEKNGKTEISVTQDNIPSEEMKAHSAENWRKVLNGMKELLEQN